MMLARDAYRVFWTAGEAACEDAAYATDAIGCAALTYADYRGREFYGALEWVSLVDVGSPV